MRAVSSGTAFGFFFNVDNATKFTAEKKTAAPPCYKHAKSLASNHTVILEKRNYEKRFRVGEIWPSPRRQIRKKSRILDRPIFR